jgi:hypothetical protein
MHPLRLYFIVSFFYFFALTMAYKEDSTLVSFGSTENRAGTSEEDKKSDDAVDMNSTTDPDSLVRENTHTTSLFNKSFTTDFLNDKHTTEAQVIDSLGWKQNFINRYIIKQGLKFVRSDSKSIGAYFSDFMLNKASLVMFFMLPIFALLLKLVYVRRKRYYMEHLTFSLHIHSFAFLILLLMLLIERMYANEWTANIAVLIILLYGILAARRVYKQPWLKTLLKGVLLFLPYMICFALITTIAVIIGGLIY